MAFEIINSLWDGPQVINTAPKCAMGNCDNPADNAGYGRYHRYCSHHHKRKYKMGGVHKQYRKSYCENEDGRLGFICTAKIIEPRWQLDVDHIDGDRHNNNSENLQTLCANCHRVKTKQRQENLQMKKRKHYLEKLLEQDNQ